MPIVPAKCPNCGGNIRINSDERAGICEYCKQPFVSEDAINNYNTYNQNTYNIEHADLHIQDENKIERKLVRAETFLNVLNEPEKAFHSYVSITESHPERYEGWWGLVKYESRNLTSCSPYHIEKAKSYAMKAIKVADSDNKQDLLDQWNDYIRNIKGCIENRPNQAGEYSELKQEEEKIEGELHLLNNKKRILEKKYDTNVSRANSGFYYPYIDIGFFVAIPMVIGMFVMLAGCTIHGTGDTKLLIIGTLLLGSPFCIAILNFIFSILAIPSKYISKKSLGKIQDELAPVEAQIAKMSSDRNRVEDRINEIERVRRADAETSEIIDSMLIE